MSPPSAENDAICLKHSSIAEIDVVAVCKGAYVGPMNGAFAVIEYLPEVGYTCKTKPGIAPEDSVRIHQQG